MELRNVMPAKAGTHDNDEQAWCLRLVVDPGLRRDDVGISRSHWMAVLHAPMELKRVTTLVIPA
jgi:hypothetical protein